MVRLPTLPDLWRSQIASSPRSVVRSSTLRTQSTPSERKVSLAAEGSPVPILYGQIRYAPLIGSVTVDGRDLVMSVLWCAGEIDSVSEIYIDDEIATGITETHYTGTTTQTADPTLAALITDYADTLIAATPGGDNGIAYSVLEISAGVTDGWPRVEGLIKGRKVYDPRTTTTVWSDNPALHLADFLSDDKIGLGLAVDWTSVDAAADACDDALSDASKRRTAGVLIDSVQSTDRIIEIMRAYAGCYVVPGSDGLKLIPNRPGATSRSLTAAHVISGSLQLTRRPQKDIPTEVEVSYTNTADWSEQRATAALAGVATGATPRRIARVSMPGIQSYAQAHREAVERLNAATLQDLIASWDTTDEALADEVGDIVALTHPVGLTAKQLRILQVTHVGPGRYSVEAEEYAAGVYSDSVATGPSPPDTNLPSPLNPPTPGALTLTEELFVDETGVTYSRIRVSWTGSDWPYSRAYRVEVTGATVVLETTITHLGAVSHVAVSGPVTQGVLYTARVWLVSTVGALSDTPSTDTLTAQGKLLLPSNVPTISGFEAGQFVALSWTPSIDIDLRGYQIRRLPAASYTDGSDTDWNNANAVTIVERVDATSFLAFSQPEGTYYYGIKARDSVDQESALAAWTQVVVTVDAAGTGFTTLDSATSGLTAMHNYELYGVGARSISSEGDAWAARFGTAGTAWSAGGTAGKAWAQEHTISGGCAWVSEEWDTGSDRVANWAWSTTVQELGSASAVQKILLADSAAYPTFTELTGAAANRSARYMKAKLTATLTGADDVIVVYSPVDASRQGKVITQTDTETLTTTQPLAVTFATAYSDPPEVTLTALGTTAKIPVADSITASGFDIYLFDAAGSTVAGSVTWQAIGS